MDSSLHGTDTQTILKLIGESLFRKFYSSYSKSVLMNIMQCVLSNRILKKGPSKHVSFKLAPSLLTPKASILVDIGALVCPYLYGWAFLS